MPAIIIPRKWRQQPRYPVKLNFSHPFCAGMVFAYSGHSQIDAFTGTPANLVGSPIQRVVRDEIGLDISGTQYIDFGDKDCYDLTGAFSLLWRGVFDATGGGYRNIISKASGNGATTTPFDFYIDSASGAVTMVRANTDLRTKRPTTTVPTAGIIQTIGFSVPAAIEINPIAWINRIPQTTFTESSGGTGAATANARTLRIGRRDDGGTQLDGVPLAVYLWAGRIPEAMYLEMEAAPYQVYKRDPQILYFDVPATGGGQTIAVAQATETDAAQAIGKIKYKAIAQATETDTVGAISPARKHPLAQAAETDVAQPITHLGTKTIAVGQAAESDFAQAIAHYKRLGILQPAETDAAQSISVGKRRTLGQVTEADTAQAIAHYGTHVGAVGQAAETDIAQHITESGSIIDTGEVITIRAAARMLVVPPSRQFVIERP